MGFYRQYESEFAYGVLGLILLLVVIIVLIQLYHRTFGRVQVTLSDSAYPGGARASGVARLFARKSLQIKEVTGIARLILNDRSPNSNRSLHSLARKEFELIIPEKYVPRNQEIEIPFSVGLPEVHKGVEVSEIFGKELLQESKSTKFWDISVIITLSNGVELRGNRTAKYLREG